MKKEPLPWVAMFTLMGLFLGLGAGWGWFAVLTALTGLALYFIVSEFAVDELLVALGVVVLAIIAFTLLNVGLTFSGVLFLVAGAIIALLCLKPGGNSPQASAAHR